MAQQQRRSLKNVVLTKKHHMSYMGLSIILSLMLLGTLYGLLLMHYANLVKEGYDFPVELALAVTTGIALLLGLGIIGTGVLAAHRIAGVHIRLRKVFDAVEQGDLDAILKFRSNDGLEQLEEAFGRMMVTVRSQVTETEAPATSESDDSGE